MLSAKRIEAADQERGDAEVVVFAQRLGHLLRRADQAGGVAAGAGQQRGARPQALVQAFAFRRGGQQAFRALVHRIARTEAGLRPALDDALLDGFGASPGFVFRGGEDRAQRQADADGAVMLGGLGPQAGGDFAHLVVGFAP